ncbi:glycoside hydrolase family 13 protein [soil metagenome]
MKNKFILLFATFCFFSFVHAQYAEVYPTNWWIGMKHNKVQLIIRGAGEGLSNQKIKISYPGITVTGTHEFSNSKYLAVDITIATTAQPGTVNIELTANGITNKVAWPLKARRKGNGTSYAQGVQSSDFIYFLMPDRFSNGDPSNDRIAGMKDQSLNRDSIYHRHGGDMQGVINHLDYIQGLGATTLWMTPVIENDMPDRTEHGYAFTDHYKIEPRFGGDASYLKLSDELHKRGMKLVQDAVYNHIGLFHWIQQDPPDKDWIHQWPTFTNPNYKEQVFFDPYAAPGEKKQMADGWFTRQMPDLNQSNPYMAQFLIQHAIWSVEKFGVDAWRIDTYKYCDLDFMNRCNQALYDEYPKITMFGENWNESVANQAYFAKNIFNTKFKSNLTGDVDFEFLFRGIQPALTQEPWGVNQLYQTASLDFMYQDPTQNVVFLDNHDMSRFFSVLDENVAKQKMAIKWLLTTRGIPQMYYGTEVIMKGISNPDGLVRLDFPGGWDGDKKNAFTQQGLTDDEKAVQDLTRRLANYRKNSSALKTGNTMQYIPGDGVYVYFRYDKNQTIMCIMNTADAARSIDFTKYAERTSGFSKAMSVTETEIYNTTDKPQIGSNEMWVLELKK